MKIYGWIGTLTFRDIRRDSLLEGLNVTSHSLAHLAFISRSMFSNCAVTSGCYTMRYKLVSSEKKPKICMDLIHDIIIKNKNNNGPNIEP